MPPVLRLVSRAGAALLVAGLLAACSTGGGGLAPGLAARMDQPGASLDRAQAIGIVNNYRATVGAPPLAEDAGLVAIAQQLAAQYAATGTPPRLPAGASVIRVSAGYPNFAETFSGWRNSPADAAALGNRRARRAGVAVTYAASSGYGTHWVLLLAP